MKHEGRGSRTGAAPFCIPAIRPAVAAGDASAMEVPVAGAYDIALPQRPRVFMLRTITTDPWNAEAPLAALNGACTPMEAFYVRNNFVPPALDEDDFRLRVRGAVERPLELDLSALRRLPQLERRVTLECAGNGRLLLDPPAPGTQWGLGAAGTAVFTGIRLADVLARAGVRGSAAECLFTGADRGEVPERGAVSFQRSLPVEVALSAEPMLAWAMNGAPLTRDHGFPLRLVVPGWYAVASVKWLVDIELIETPFAGHFQVDRYVYLEKGKPVAPVTAMRVRALITSPAAGAVVAARLHRIEGVAWSGAAPIVRVELSVDGGDWIEAGLQGESAAGASVAWSVEVPLHAGDCVLRARATDATGAVQPSSPSWNELGYGNNAVHEVSVSVR